MHPSTVEALRRYRWMRDLAIEFAQADAPFFVGTRGKRRGLPLTRHQVERVFASLREQLGWGNRGTHNAPRITAEIRRGDETELRSDDVRGRSFAPIGQTPVGRVSSRREGLSIISTVTNRGQMRWKIFDGALNAEILNEFMARLIKGATKKALSDSRQPQSPSHKPVKAWLAQHSEQTEVFYLPGSIC